MNIIKGVGLMILGVFTLVSRAQNTQQISISPYIDEASGIPNSVESVVYSRLGSIITSCGFANAFNQRFVLVPKVSVVTEDITDTPTPLTSTFLDEKSVPATPSPIHKLIFKV